MWNIGRMCVHAGLEETCRTPQGCNLTCWHLSKPVQPVQYLFFNCVENGSGKKSFSLLSAPSPSDANYWLLSKLFRKTNRGGFCEMHKALRHQQPGETSIPSALISSHVIKLGRAADVCGHPLTWRHFIHRVYWFFQKATRIGFLDSGGWLIASPLTFICNGHHLLARITLGRLFWIPLSFALGFHFLNWAWK